MKYLYKPLSKKMIDQLRRARAIELSDNGKNICGLDDFKDTLPALYNHRVVDIKMAVYEGKEILCVYITKAGIDFLERYEEDLKILEERNKKILEERNRYNAPNWLTKENINALFIRVCRL